MRCHRLSCSTVLLVSAMLPVATALAEPVEYLFNGHFGARTTAAEGFPAFAPGAGFSGSVKIDADRTFVDPATGAVRPAPVAALQIRTQFLPPAELSITTPLDARSRFRRLSVPNGEGFFVRAAGALDGDTVLEISLSWGAPGAGQVPANPLTVNLAALEPNSWRVTISAMSAACYPQCSGADYTAAGHILTLRTLSQVQQQFEFQRFDNPPAGWVNIGGDWTAQNGYYANAANVPFTTSLYLRTGVLQSQSSISASLYSGWPNSGNTLGLVFNYQDPANFYEIRINPLGLVAYNKVVDGVRTRLAVTGICCEPTAPRMWIPVEVIRDGGRTEVYILGAEHFFGTYEDEAEQFYGGHAGVFASWNQARVDDVRIFTRHNWFGLCCLAPEAGTWIQEAGEFRNTTIQQAAITLASTADSVQADFTIDTRVNLKWSAPGNRGGIVYHYQDARNYRAALVSAMNPRTGEPGKLEVIEVRGGLRTVVAQSTVNVSAGKWAALSVSHVDGVTTVRAPGLAAPFLVLAQTEVYGSKSLGLIASWNLVRFDDVVILPEVENPG
jgi:hypothetical protein